METLRVTVLGVCCAAVALALAEQVVPTDRFRRQLRMMVTLLMLTAVLRPLAGLDLSALTQNFPADTSTTEDLKALAETAYTEAISERILDTLNSRLEEHSVSCRVTALRVHISADGGISISEAVIKGNTLTGTVYLREWLGNDVTITKEAEE